MSLVSGLLNQTLTSISKVTEDGYGDNTYTVTYTDIPCKFIEGVEHKISPTGETIIYNAKLFLYSNIIIKEEYRVVYNSKTYTVQKVGMKYDLDGNQSHIECYLK